MPKRLNISITKSNVLRIKEELEFAREGYDLLEQKREVLVMEVMGLMEDFRRCKKDVEDSLSAAYEQFKKATMILGEKRIRKGKIFATRDISNEPSRVSPPHLPLNEGSRAVGAGIVVPNLSDDFVGKAPDLGAYEFGRKMPHYGPRR